MSLSNRFNFSYESISEEKERKKSYQYFWNAFLLKGKNLDADDLAKVDLLRRVQVGMEE